MKIALLGYGAIARRHLANARALLGDPRAVVLRGSDAPLNEEDAWASRARTLGDVLDFGPDAAIVASPASEHIPQARALAERGAHLFLEKPLSRGMEGVCDLIALCARRKLALMVGYNMAFLDSLNGFISLVRSGGVGELLSVHAEVGQYLPDWRPHLDYRRSVSACAELGGGALLELSHEIEYVDRLIGGARSVFCLTRRTGLLEMDAEDAADVILRNADGAAAGIHMNMEQRTPYRSCCATGTEGMLYMNLSDGVLHRRSGGAGWQAYKEYGCADRNRAYREELAHFFACVRGEAAPFPDGERGRAVLEIVAAAKVSAEEGVLVSL